MEKIKETFSEITEFFSGFVEIFTTTLFKLGQSNITLGTILYFIFGFIILNFVSKKFKNLLVNKILLKTKIEPAASASIGLIVRVVFVFVGSIVIIQSAGIDMSSLSLLAGALGVGIGFGLQNITDNFISGIIILFEKPIKVGDRIEVGDVEGDVISISVRATTVLTNDNISVIVPNSEFISSKVINWSHNDRSIRFKVPLGVSYNEDPEAVKKILLKVAEENEFVLSKPAPHVFFDEFGDSSLNSTLAIWTDEYTDRPKILKSQLYFSIFKEFKENNIEIPFPQRDLH
ncbi:MAG: mechanosensitive ion channel domain-containing protein, partial [Bacteroidota bacterium]